ncbi:hypothetical protein RJ640_025677 [Escallonia rubra]|uniref:RING-type E3 ubiquitin transferase n=1 Tax=Escallonia rubra TaxID=112253 RepID=A0AA88RR70_9ASTE|nr:hypothetical protein RJ640_025677 [Escallonia rubra]
MPMSASSPSQTQATASSTPPSQSSGMLSEVVAALARDGVALTMSDNHELSGSTTREVISSADDRMDDAMYGELHEKKEPLPASKASIEALPKVKMQEEGVPCAICLTDLSVGVESKEMPCKHKYHPDCIDQWLGINGSCPVCRFEMPVEGADHRGEEEGTLWGIYVYYRIGETGEVDWGNSSSDSGDSDGSSTDGMEEDQEVTSY